MLLYPKRGNESKARKKKAILENQLKPAIQLEMKLIHLLRKMSQTCVFRLGKGSPFFGMTVTTFCGLIWGKSFGITLNSGFRVKKFKVFGGKINFILW